MISFTVSAREGSRSTLKGSEDGSSVLVKKGQCDAVRGEQEESSFNRPTSRGANRSSIRRQKPAVRLEAEVENFMVGGNGIRYHLP